MSSEDAMIKGEDAQPYSTVAIVTSGTFARPLPEDEKERIAPPHAGARATSK